MPITLAPLNIIAASEIMALHNHPKVRRHLPLAQGEFELTTYHNWLTSKEDLWNNYGYGPWAILIEEQFAGWGGFQSENDDADFGLVLKPEYWGFGKRIYQMMEFIAIHDFKLESITALLPLSRGQTRTMERLGFSADGHLCLTGITFRRWRKTIGTH